MNKKGGLADIVAAMAGIIALITVFFLGHLLTNAFIDNGGPLLDVNESSSILTRTQTYYTSTADNLVIFLWVGLLIGALGSALITKVNRIVFFFNIITMMLFIVVSVTMMYWYNSLEEAEAFASIVNFYPKTHYLMQNLPLFTLIGMIMIALALWAGSKSRSPEFA